MKGSAGQEENDMKRSSVRVKGQPIFFLSVPTTSINKNRKEKTFTNKTFLQIDLVSVSIHKHDTWCVLSCLLKEKI